MQITDRIAAVLAEIDLIVSEMKGGPAVEDGVGKMGMAQYFISRALEDRRNKAAKIMSMAEVGGLDHSLPAGDR